MRIHGFLLPFLRRAPRPGTNCIDGPPVPSGQAGSTGVSLIVYGNSAGLVNANQCKKMPAPERDLSGGAGHFSPEQGENGGTGPPHSCPEIVKSTALLDFRRRRTYKIHKYLFELLASFTKVFAFTLKAEFVIINTSNSAFMGSLRPGAG